MEELGPAIATLAVAGASLGLQSTPDARLWLPADLLYSLRLPAGSPALVGVAGSPSTEPAPLVERFAAACHSPGLAVSAGATQPLDAAGLGSRMVAAELWPAQGLAKGTAVPSAVLRDALARPEAGAHLLVYASAASGGSSSSYSSGSRLECSEVYVRLCRRQGQGRGGAEAAPALLPADEERGSSSAAEPAATPEPASPAAVQSPAMRGRSGTPIALSPAMRGGAAPPVALGPAGRGGGASPSVTRGRSSAGTPQSSGKSATQGRPVTPSASSSSSGRAVAAAARVQDRAKAEALLATLLSEDPSPRVRRMVEALLLRQLGGRSLLAGNLVALPVFGQRAVFAVEHVALRQRSSSAEVAAQSAVAAAEAAGSSKRAGDSAQAAVLPPVTAATIVRLLLEGEAAPDAATGQQQQQQQDWAGLATAEAAEALGCSIEDAGPLAARRAVMAGLNSRGITFDQLGGAAKQRQALRELVTLPLKSPQLFASYNITPPRGVLLYGPPGTGKTVLACATAAAAGARFLVVNGPEVVSEYYGESETGLRGIFAAAVALAPSVIFIDELDSLAPSRGGGPGGGKGSSGSGSSARVVSALLTEMDTLGAARVVVVAATNRPDSLDSALRRPGRFDREVEVGVPPPADRRDILAKQLRGMAHSLTPEQVAELADSAHGFVAADLAALCNEAAMIALRRTVVGSSGDCPCVTLADFRAAETRTRPSAMRELAFEVPKVSWDDIGGLEEVKQRLKEAVELPFQNPEALARLGVVPPQGILLYGPPGCSKTLLARAVASQARLNFISVKGPELFSKYVGESEKALAALFAKARTSSPSIIFFDEIDGLAMMRDSSGDAGVGVGERMLSQLLQEMDGLQARAGVIVIGATNRPDCLDPALLRPGRFDRLVEVPPPDCSARAAIFAVHTRCMPLASDMHLDSLAQQTNGFSGAAIAACCKEAALAALEDDISASCVTMPHFLKGIVSLRSRQQLLM